MQRLPQDKLNKFNKTKLLSQKTLRHKKVSVIHSVYLFDSVSFTQIFHLDISQFIQTGSSNVFTNAPSFVI